ncbi:MAG TPA: hypothetical protein VIK32_04885 [Candidatus Limnocylindrales bacterium]
MGVGHPGCSIAEVEEGVEVAPLERFVGPLSQSEAVALILGRYEAGASGGWVALGGCWVGSVSFEFPIGAGSGPGLAESKVTG